MNQNVVTEPVKGDLEQGRCPAISRNAAANDSTKQQVTASLGIRDDKNVKEGSGEQEVSARFDDGNEHDKVKRVTLLAWVRQHLLVDIFVMIALVFVIAIISVCLGVDSIEDEQEVTSSPLDPDAVIAPSKSFASTQELHNVVDAYLGNLLPFPVPSSIDTREYGHPIGMWDVSLLTDFSHVFDLHHRGKDIRLISAVKSFNEDLSKWNVSKAVTMERMFYGANSFNQPLQHWDTKGVKNMKKMFMNAYAFNHPLGEWEVQNVRTMDSMFSDACSFNQPLNRWVVSGVTSMAFMFRSAKAFDQTLQDWKVSSVADMHGMFLYTNKFNRPLNDWDVSSVKTMQWMFGLTRLYNQPLDKWNVSSVINSSKMFLHASAFNQNLCSWENEFVPRQSMMDLQGMFKSSACPRQDDPDLTLHPPSPFCHGCD